MQLICLAGVAIALARQGLARQPLVRDMLVLGVGLEHLWLLGTAASWDARRLPMAVPPADVRRSLLLAVRLAWRRRRRDGGLSPLAAAMPLLSCARLTMGGQAQKIRSQML